MNLIFTLLEDAAALLMLAVFAVPLFLLARGAGWAWERRNPSRLERVLAEAERARVDAIMADPALWESMERRAEQ